MNTDKKEWAMGAFAARMGQDKNKNSASGLARFLLLFCQSQTTGIIGAHPSHPRFTDKVQRSTLDSRRSSHILAQKRSLSLISQ
jgi:hypothetical protein